MPTMNTTPMCGLETHTHLYKGSKRNLTMDADDLLKILHDGRSPIPLNTNVVAAPNSMATIENSRSLKVTELDSEGS